MDFFGLHYHLFYHTSLKWQKNVLSNVKSIWGFPSGSVVKNWPANARHMGSILGAGRSPREGNVNLFQHSCLGIPMDRGVWWATVHGSQRVGHNLATKQQLKHNLFRTSLWCSQDSSIWSWKVQPCHFLSMELIWPRGSEMSSSHPAERARQADPSLQPCYSGFKK